MTSERTADADVAIVRESLETQKVRVGYRGERVGALAALDRLVARNQQLQEALERISLMRGCEDYYPESRDRAVEIREIARAALASVRARTPQ